MAREHAGFQLRQFELLYDAAGASAVNSAGFERCLRDARAAAHHIVATATNFAAQPALCIDVSKSVWSIDSR